MAGAMLRGVSTARALEPGKQDFLDELERLQTRAGKPQRLVVDIDACQDHA